MSLSTILQKLTVLAVILVIVTSIAFAGTLIITSKEMPAGGLSEDTSLFQKSVTNEKIKNLKLRGPNIEENDNKTTISSQHFMLPHLWNAIIACMVLLVCSTVALIWDAERQGKINLCEVHDQDQKETM
jgi:hypothetical protein